MPEPKAKPKAPSKSKLDPSDPRHPDVREREGRLLKEPKK